VIRRYDPDWDDMVRRGDHRISGHGHYGVVVACGQRIGEVAYVVGNKCVHEREIRPKRRFQQVLLALQFDLALALFDQCADARRCENAAEAI
jgi:hypothetical protein